MYRLEAFNALIREPRLFRRSEFMVRNCPVDRQDGIYAWFFDNVIEGLDSSACYRLDGIPLLYVGIARKSEDTNPARHMRDRIREHFNGNAAGSTLRLSLGCLLGLELRQVGGNKTKIKDGREIKTKPRYIFANGGEARLDQWLQQHARVAWMPVERPWEVEPMVFGSGLHLPINIERHQGRGSFVSRTREEAKERAKTLPWIPEDGGRL